MIARVKFSHLIALCAAGAILSGCSTSSSMSKTDEENFKHPPKLSAADQAKALSDYQSAAQKEIAARQASGHPVPGLPSGGMAPAPGMPGTGGQ